MQHWELGVRCELKRRIIPQKSICDMKGFKSILAMVSALVLMSGCSAAYYSSVAAGDGMYGVHDKIAIAKQQQQRAELQRAEAEARRAEWEAKIAEIQARNAEEAYNDLNYTTIVADSYESAYARRLNGFRSPTYRLPSSYYDYRYGEAYSYATAYDPAFYNIMVSGDQVWVEPKYISSMFGTWGATNVTPVFGNWYFGWTSPYYYNYGAWWGYPHYSWWDWNWGICYNPYYSWWGYGWGPSWGYNHYHPHWGWGPGYYPPHHGAGRPPHHGSAGVQPPRREQIVNRPSYTSPSSGKNYGNRQPARGTVNGSGVVDRQIGSTTSRATAGARGVQGGSGVSRGTTSQPSRGVNSGSGTVNSNQGGRSSYFKYNGGRSSWDNDSGTRTMPKADPWGSRSGNSTSSYGSGSSGGGYSGGSSSSSGGGHRGGNSLGR